MAKRQKATPSSKLHDDESEKQAMSETFRSLLNENQEDKDARAKHELAVDTAGRYLRLAALAWARENLDPLYQNDDARIAQVETMLRAARHMRRTSILDGDPIPSVRLADGSVIPLTTRLLELMNPDKVLQANNRDDYRSPSKTNKASMAGRKARAEIEAIVRQVLREGEIVA